MILVDTNVLVDVATKDPVWFDWSCAEISKAVNSGSAAINPLIYTELVPLYDSLRELGLNLVPPSRFRRLVLPFSAAASRAFLAYLAYLAYREAGGQKTSPLPVFFIGAHAEAEGFKLLTRDAVRYRTYFPKVKLIAP